MPRQIIDVERGVAVAEDTETGNAMLRFYDQAGRPIAVRLSPQQFETLAIGVWGLAKARNLMEEVG